MRLKGKASDETVAVVLTTYNDTEFLRDALISVFAQQQFPDEVYVVDDGSNVSPASIVSEFPGAKLILKANGGLASARNAGLSQATTQFITFLDADDRMRPNAILDGVNAFVNYADAAMVYGAHIRIGSAGEPLSPEIYRPTSYDPYADLLTGNRIGMHATVLYRRDVLLKIGGFDEHLRRCEDYDVYLKIARDYSVASYPAVVAEYRWHGGNMSRDTGLMLEAALAVHDRHKGQKGSRRRAWCAGRKFWKSWYKHGQQAWDRELDRTPPVTGKAKRAANTALRHVQTRPIAASMFASTLRKRASLAGKTLSTVLGSTEPVSLDFGWDRGTPVDRYYIESFLNRHAADIRGHVLEIGDDSYSRRFGGSSITKQDVLHLDTENSKTTIVGDLTDTGVLADAAFDCILFTQTLQLIFDLPNAVGRLWAALRPGGILLLTVPGISQIDRGEWGANWCWSFTPRSIRLLLEPQFGTSPLIETHGNVLAATAFLQGIVLEEVDRAKLDVIDRAYPVVITTRAEKS